MFLTKKGKFSYELASKTLKKLLYRIKLIASDFQKNNKTFNNLELEHNSGQRIIRLNPKDFLILPLDLLFEEQDYELVGLVKKMSEDFIRGNKWENQTSVEFVYGQLIQLLGDKIFYDLKEIDLPYTISFFNKLKEMLSEDILPLKIIVFPVIGASLKQSEKCSIGSVEFTNTLDFMKEYSSYFNRSENSNFSQVDKNFKTMCEQSDLIARLKIGGRDSTITRNAANEIMKRVYTLVKLILPRTGYNYLFFGTLGDEFLDEKHSFLFQLDNSNGTSFLNYRQTKNSLFNKNINLLQVTSKYRQGNKREEIWFHQCETIIEKYIKNDDVTDFQKRVWTALYWFGEAMVERESNSLIIKYATCLEALFNSREGGISEQIAEFTAFINSTLTDERIYIYDNVKKLYQLRSSAVHGGYTGVGIDEIFLYQIRRICEDAIIRMICYSCQEEWQNPKSYQNFIRFILRNYRFSQK